MLLVKKRIIIKFIEVNQSQSLMENFYLPQFLYKINQIPCLYTYNIQFPNIFWNNCSISQFNPTEFINNLGTNHSFQSQIQIYNSNKDLISSKAVQPREYFTFKKQNTNVPHIDSENIDEESSFLSKKQITDQNSVKQECLIRKSKEQNDLKEKQKNYKHSKNNKNFTEQIDSNIQISRKSNEKRNKKIQNRQKGIIKIRKSKIAKSYKQKKQVGHWKRTILSNMYRDVFAYLIKRQKSQKVVSHLLRTIKKPKKLLEQSQKTTEYTLKRYYNYQLNLKEMQHYYPKDRKFELLRKLLNPSGDIYLIQEQNYYNKISRITAKLFIQKQLLSNILNKQKLQKLSAEQCDQFYLKHVQAYRALKKSMRQAFRN